MVGMTMPGACLITCCVFLLFTPGCSGNTDLRRQSFLLKPDSRKNTAKVEVYYEALCPDSVQFLNGSLRSAWEDADLRDRMSLHLYPFGNGHLLKEEHVSQGYHFWHPGADYPLVLCQHGSRECLGNTIQACALADLEATKHMPFVLCMVSYGTQAGPELTSYACGTRLGIDMAKLKACATSRRGHDLLIEHGQRSLNPDLGRKYVPFVMVNGRHSEIAEKGDLIGAICGTLDAPKPTACSNRSAQGSDHKANGKKGCGHGGSGEGF